MNDKPIIFTQDHRIDTTMINFNQRLGLFGLLGIVQDAAVEHANKLGLTYENMLEKGFFWVLIQQRLRMSRWPLWNDEIIVKTWPKKINGIYAIREYEMFLGDEKIGECSTTWMILDSQTHRPKRLTDNEYQFLTRDDYNLSFTAEKIRLPEVKLVKTIEVSISDLDMNQHVNNIQYARWILDTIPVDYHKRYVVKEYQINFSGETFLGDQIDCFSSAEKPSNEPSESVYFSGIRQDDGKTVFTAKLTSQQLISE